MKKYMLIMALLSGFIQASCQVSAFYVPPSLTNPAYIAAQDSHLVVINHSLSNNKLFVFLGGTGSITKYYLLLPQLAAGLGYHVLSIAYPDTPTVGSICALSRDSLCYDDVHQEVCYGTPLSGAVSVDTLNSIYMRLVYLLQYLDSAYPADGWGQFITGNAPMWSNIVLSGHSQGSGHAMYMAKREPCAGVLMFSGADDYSSYFKAPAHWMYGAGETAADKLFAFVSLGDELVTFPEYYQIMQTLGMESGGDDTVDIDNLSTPYRNSRMLYTDATPQHLLLTPYHNSTAVDYYTPLNVDDTPLFDPVWTYMLSGVIATGITELTPAASCLYMYPNPCKDYINLLYNSNDDFLNSVQVYNDLGQKLISREIGHSKAAVIDLHKLPPGFYMLSALTGNKQTLVRKLIVGK